MQSHTRAVIAAAAYAVIVGKKVTGIYDHTAAEHLRIAAECRGHRVQVADGERPATFGGTLPDLYDDGDKAFVSLDVVGTRASGYDRGSATHYVAEVTDRLIQVYDYGLSSWFAYEVQVVGEGAFANT